MRKRPRMARVDPQNPRGWATCMRSGFVAGDANDIVLVRVYYQWPVITKVNGSGGCLPRSCWMVFCM